MTADGCKAHCHGDPVQATRPMIKTSKSNNDIRLASPVRIGVLGAARVATYALIEPARADMRAEVVAIAARDPVRAQLFAEKQGIERVLPSYEALLADAGIDLVYIATPPSTHASLAISALRGGKHVLVEKPFAMNTSQAAAVIAAARESGVRVFEAMHAPHHRMFAEIEATVSSGRLGRIRRIEAHFSTFVPCEVGEFRWSAARGGGALMDLGVYPLAFCRRLLGEDFSVAGVEAEFKKGVDTRCRIDICFGEVPARISFSMIDPSSAWLDITGEDGTLLAENPVAPSLGHCLTETSALGTWSRSFPAQSSWSSQLAAVIGCLLDDTPFPFSPDDPLASMIALDRIRAHPRWISAANGSNQVPSPD